MPGNSKSIINTHRLYTVLIVLLSVLSASTLIYITRSIQPHINYDSLANNNNFTIGSRNNQRGLLSINSHESSINLNTNNRINDNSISSVEVNDTYIVTFYKYKTYKQHEQFIVKLLGPSKPNYDSIDNGEYYWMNIPRHNPAQNYPTDFLLIQLISTGAHNNTHHTNSESLSILETNSEIKYITKQRQFRQLLSLDFEDDVEQYKPDNVADFRIPPRFSSYSGFATDIFDGNNDNIDYNISVVGSHARKLCNSRGEAGESVSARYGANKLWDLGFSGRDIKVAIFDTGLASDHSHFRRIKDRSNWTDEKQLEDGLGHGTFVAGVIASENNECSGFAPDAELYIFRVFNQKQLSFTSWFLDAFNYAIRTKVNILNLSIGGPDFLDSPFVDKVQEMSANSIIVVSAIGNDGPLYGTLNNPADQPDVIGVGGLDSDDNSLASFSSRGMTTWELPHGYGRVKPDVLGLAKSIKGSKIHGGCRSLSGTSVASPVIAGAVTLLASTINPTQRKSLLNPATMKQVLTQTSILIPNTNIFEQGNGKLNLIGAFEYLKKFEAHASAIPNQLDLTNCPYMWPYCTQDFYYSAQPIIVNITLLNSISVTSFILDPPVFQPDNTDSNIVNIDFQYSDVIWPWSGYLAAFITIKHDIDQKLLIASGNIKLTVTAGNMQSDIVIPVKLRITPRPPRNRRIIFDQFHNLRYPSGYFPRDNLEIKSDTLDWNGDHLHTNYKDLYAFLRSKGYYIEVLGQDFTCFDAQLYGILLIVDPEDEYFPEEIEKLYSDVTGLGLSVVLLGDWYNQQVMREIKFYDENTASWWTPETGGANIPALNQLLARFDISFSDHVVKGTIQLNDEIIQYASGTTIATFPTSGYLFQTFLTDAGSKSESRNYAILGAYQPQSLVNESGRIIVYGDSNCIDMNHRSGPPCIGLMFNMIDYAANKNLNPTIFPSNSQLTKPYVDGTIDKSPQRMLGNNLMKYSHVINPQAKPSCAAKNKIPHKSVNANEYINNVQLENNHDNAVESDATPGESTLKRSIPNNIQAAEDDINKSNDNNNNDKLSDISKADDHTSNIESSDNTNSNHIRGNAHEQVFGKKKSRAQTIQPNPIESVETHELDPSESTEYDDDQTTNASISASSTSSTYLWFAIAIVLVIILYLFRRSIPILSRFTRSNSRNGNYRRGVGRSTEDNKRSPVASMQSVMLSNPNNNNLSYRERVDREMNTAILA